MTDDDFNKVDEDFASEFDFVDTQPGGASASGADGSVGGPPPKGTPAIVSLMILISILGGGYFAYTHFFSKAPTLPPPPPKAADHNDLPTLPEHMPTAGPVPAPAISNKEQAANAVAEALNGKSNSELSTALPGTNPTGEKSFEQMQKELHTQTAPAAAPQAINTVPTEVRVALQNISDEMTMNVNNIQQLENTMSNVSTTLEHLNKTISAMDNRVLSLTETVDGLSQDLANVKKIMVDQDLDLTMPGNVKMSSKRQQIQPISSSEPNYSVHAIIPGRAWLKSNSGQIITVTEGDKVGDYGTVAVIDAANGLVRTSSGIVLR